MLLEEVERVCGGKIKDGKLIELIDEFRHGLDSVMKQNETIAKSNIRQELKSNSDNYIKNLLNKMDYVINNKLKKKPAETKKKYEASTSDKPNIGSRLQMISSKLDGKSADKYLNDEKEIEKSAFANNFMKKSKYPKPNDSGFDLEDALNPKEDLDEIMKSFDFFVSDTDEKKVN